MAAIPPAAVSFDEGAPGYEQIVARALLPVAGEVVRRAALRPGELVLDVGTGTGITLAAAAGDGRQLVGLDAAPHMLQIARKRLPGAAFVLGDFAAMPFPDGRYDAVLSSHALLFADDRVAVLREMRRVARAGARLSLSVPGPVEATPAAMFDPIYARYGIATAGRYPEAGELAAWAAAAGWVGVETAADPTVAIRLPDEAAFRTWRNLGARGQATRGWTPEQHEALTQDMLAGAPQQPDGSFRLPFGALYLSARAPDTSAASAVSGVV
jgi:ubiquinone/menaquinone biosynthesis C-methylase UbiE